MVVNDVKIIRIAAAFEITSPFDTTSHKTERTINQKSVEWINQTVKEKNLPIGVAELFS